MPQAVVPCVSKAILPFVMKLLTGDPVTWLLTEAIAERERTSLAQDGLRWSRSG